MGGKVRKYGRRKKSGNLYIPNGRKQLEELAQEFEHCRLENSQGSDTSLRETQRSRVFHKQQLAKPFNATFKLDSIEALRATVTRETNI